MRTSLLLILYFPAVAFLVAAILELRTANIPVLKRFRNMAPAVLGMAAFVLSLYTDDLLRSYGLSPTRFAHTMTMIFAALSCSGVFISLSRRSSAIWVAVGGLLMTLFWTVSPIV
jgi:hypothetical protein